MIVTYQQDNRYSAAVAGGGVVCYQLPRAAAAAAICDALGVNLTEANRLLDNPASPAEWRATFSAAVAADLESLSDEVETLADRERAEKLAARITTLGEMLAEIHAQQTEANRLAAEANKLAADKLAADQRQAKEREAIASKQRLLAEQQQARAAEEQRKRRDLRAVRNSDGTVDLTEADFAKTGTQVIKVRRLVARYKANEVLPPEVAAMLK
ncbi:hypothetical protein [Lacipirellula parvula]|uniref:Uncharacterized protein n=1 Tax=Lacipirellula parvula TaxID=2650471 RepID=A0A5K7XCF5_9BACT|nr:hypothetical protein [Lacipirellula parvula]BBO34464.1 hypothetical protein PLANPX_4076 [Lacipirellula parvula]